MPPTLVLLARAGVAGFFFCALPVLCEPPPLRSAASFAILGGSSVGNAGETRVTGNLGVSPGNTISGFPPGLVRIGAIYRDDALARQARRDADAVRDDLEARACTATLPPVIEDGTTLDQGVYCFDGADVRIAGSLALDAAGDRTAVWIFRVAGALATVDGASVFAIRGGQDGHVFWQVGGAATVGAGSALIGNVFALTDITLRRDARLSGRALARNGAVRLEESEISLCCSPITLSPPALADGSVGAPYTAPLTAGGGLAPYAFTVPPSAIPPGLSLSSGGVLSGRPTTLGTYRFAVTATDARNCIGTSVYEIGIDCAGTTELPDAIIGKAYSTMLPSDGTCSVLSGSLPPGLAFDGCTVAGIPEAAGTYAFVAKTGDAIGCYAIDVIPCPLELSAADPPDGTACTPYGGHAFIASGGPAPHTFTAEGLPEGLSLSADGVLSGTPATPGDFTPRVTATNALCSVFRTYAMSVTCPEIAVAPPKLKDGIAGVAYSEALTAAPCAGHLFSADEVPPGLTLSLDGALTGIPTKAGTHVLGVTAKATNGCSGAAERIVDIGCPPLVFSPEVLPPLEEDVPYDVLIEATGAIGPYEYRVTDGAVPPGLTLLLTGRLIGTPADSGSFDFTVTATDTTSGCVGSRTYTNSECAIEIAPSFPPNGTVGTPYSEAFEASGGAPPYVFSVAGGSLPPGLMLSPAGALSGTPMMAGTFDFALRITDAAGCVREFSFCAVDIHAAACPSGTTITMSPANLPFGTPGEPYGQAITPSGGTSPYTFAVTSGTLPAGLTLDSMTGLISGVPAAADVARLTVTVTDDNGCRGSRCYTLYVGVEIPTLSEEVALLLCMVLACAGWVAARRLHG